MIHITDPAVPSIYGDIKKLHQGYGSLSGLGIGNHAVDSFQLPNITDYSNIKAIRIYLTLKKTAGVGNVSCATSATSGEIAATCPGYLNTATADDFTIIDVFISNDLGDLDAFLNSYQYGNVGTLAIVGTGKWEGDGSYPRTIYLNINKPATVYSLVWIWEVYVLGEDVKQ